MQSSKRLERFLVFGLNGDGHALLALGNENFPRRKAGLFEWYLCQVNFASIGVFCHFTNGGGKASCTVVGDAGDEACVSCFKHHVEHFLSA